MVEVDPTIIIAVIGVLVVLAAVLLSWKTSSAPAECPVKRVTSSKTEKSTPEEATKPKKKNKSANKKSVKPVSEEDLNTAPAPATKKVTLATVEPVTVKAPSIAVSEPPAASTKKIPEESKKKSKPSNGAHDKPAALPSAMKPAAAPAPDESHHVNMSTTELLSAATTYIDTNQSDDAWAVVKTKKKAVPVTAPSTTSASSNPNPEPAAAIASQPAESITAAAAQATSQTPAEPIDRTTDEVSVPAKKVGSIIGTKGCVKIALQVATGTDIQFPKDKPVKESTESVTATITGPAEGVKKAKKAIQDLVSKGYSGILEGEDFRETQVPVHNMYLPEIIGKGGANIKALQEKLQVRITVPQTPTPSNGITNATNEVRSSVKIGISGLKDNVIRAKAMIKELIQYYHTEITHPGIVHEELDIPTSYYNYIIGAKGSEIKHIQANFKVNVHIPNLESINKNVVVVGIPLNVDNAKKYMLKIIDNVINGVKKDSKSKVVTNEEDEVDVVPVDMEESTRAHEVLFTDLLQGARHIQGSHVPQHMNAHNGNMSHMMKPAVEEVSPVPIIDPSSKPVVASVWNTGNTLTGSSSGGGMLAAGTTGVEW